MRHFLLRLPLVLLFFILLYPGLKVAAQPLPCPVSTTSSVDAGVDTTICDGQCATLKASSITTLKSTSSYIFSQPAYMPQPYNQGTSILLNIDDTWSDPITLPFPFCFFGTHYTQIQIGSNGNISFDVTHSTAPGGNAYTVSNPIPSNYSSYNNCIMAPFFDMDPTRFGNITYNTYGTAPCRVFVVSWDSCGTYPNLPNNFPGAAYPATQQIVLYESTHVVDINVHMHTFYNGSTSNGRGVLGIQNANATQAYAAPGKNNTQFNITDESYRFVPSGAPATFYTWKDSVGNIVGTTQNLSVCPSQTTTYYLTVLFTSQCDSIYLTDNVTVNVGGNPKVDSVQKKDPSYCGNNDGSLTLFGLEPNEIYKIDYSKNGIPQTQLQQTASSIGTLTISGLTAGMYANIGVRTELCNPGNRMGPYVLIDSPIKVEFTTMARFTCDGQDTVVFTNNTTTPGPINYTWVFGDGNRAFTRDATHVYGRQGNYTVTLIADNGICRDSIKKQVTTLHPLDAFFLVDYPNACLNQVVKFRDSSVTTTQNGTGPQYFWDFGDGTTATGDTTSHAFNQVGTFTVRLVVQDFVPCTDTFYRTIVVGAPPIVSFVTNSSNICEGQGILFTADFHNEVPARYEWTFSDGTLVPDTNPITHSFDSSGTYNILLTTHYLYCPDTNYNANITVQPFPGINLGPDTALCPNASPVTLRNLADFGSYPGANYTWNTGATTPSIAVNQPGTYGATITYNGCSATDSMTIFKDCYLDIPNSFTPNGDGLNDYFLPRQNLSRSLVSYKMTVYNRWGQVIFEAVSLEGRGWDGKFNNVDQPSGVYIYIIDAAYKDGRTEHYTDNVTLLR